MIRRKGVIYTMNSSSTCLLIVSLLAANALANPVGQKAKIDKQQDAIDPLEAVPSSHQSVVYEQASDLTPAHRTEIQYVYQTQPETATYGQEAAQQMETPARSTLALLQSGQYSPQDQFRQQTQDKSDEGHVSADCLHKHEYVSLASLSNQQQQLPQLQRQQPAGSEQNDYQAEVVYANPNEEATTSRGANLEQVVSSSVTQASGLPATILTEVPANEMPQEVLDKLKKDYGVKVVATRERPGANLVINCDDVTHAATSICAQQTQSTERLSHKQIRMQHEIIMPAPDYMYGEQNAREHYGRRPRSGPQAPYSFSRSDYTLQSGGPMQVYEPDSDLPEGYTTDSIAAAKHQASDDDSARTAPVDSSRTLTSTQAGGGADAYRSRTTPTLDQSEVGTPVSGLTETSVMVESTTTPEQADDSQEAGHEQQGGVAGRKHQSTNAQHFNRQDF